MIMYIVSSVEPVRTDNKKRYSFPYFLFKIRFIFVGCGIVIVLHIENSIINPPTTSVKRMLMRWRNGDDICTGIRTVRNAIMTKAEKHNKPKDRNCNRFLMFILDAIAIVGKKIKKISCGYIAILTAI